MSGKRSDRLAHQLRDEISQIIQRGEVKDPRVGFASIPGVRLTKDLGHARVFVSVYGSKEEGEATLKALKHAQGYIRTLLSKRLRVRQIPDLDFILDTSIQDGIRMNEIINALPEVQEQSDAPVHEDDEPQSTEHENT